MNRAERRRQERESGNSRVIGWVQHPSPKQLKYGTGWVNEFDRMFRDESSQYVVMVRSVETEWGIVEHACMKNVADTDIPWSEKQRIKNELFGKERIAVEVFPKESELVDAANMYHLWVLPVEMTLPFGID